MNIVRTGDAPRTPGSRWQRGLCSGVAQDCNNWKDSSWHPTHSRTLDSRLKHTPSLSFKKAYLFVLELFWWSGFRFAIHVEVLETLSGNIGQGIPSLYSPLAVLQLTGTSQKEVYTLFWNPDFCNCFTQGIPLDILVWKPAGFKIVSHRTVYICIL